MFRQFVFVVQISLLMLNCDTDNERKFAAAISYFFLLAARDLLYATYKIAHIPVMKHWLEAVHHER